MKCPICQQTIQCADESQRDQILSAHIAQCQNEQEAQQTAMDRGIAAALGDDSESSVDDDDDYAAEESVTLHNQSTPPNHGLPPPQRRSGGPPTATTATPTIVSAIHMGRSSSFGEEDYSDSEHVHQAYAVGSEEDEYEPEQSPPGDQMPKKKKWQTFSFWIILFLILLVCLLIGGLVGAIVATRGGGKDKNNQEPTTTGSAADCGGDPVCLGIFDRGSGAGGGSDRDGVEGDGGGKPAPAGDVFGTEGGPSGGPPQTDCNDNDPDCSSGFIQPPNRRENRRSLLRGH